MEENPVESIINDSTRSSGFALAKRNDIAIFNPLLR